MNQFFWHINVWDVMFLVTILHLIVDDLWPIINTADLFFPRCSGGACVFGSGAVRGRSRRCKFHHTHYVSSGIFYTWSTAHMLQLYWSLSDALMFCLCVIVLSCPADQAATPSPTRPSFLRHLPRPPPFLMPRLVLSQTSPYLWPHKQFPWQQPIVELPWQVEEGTPSREAMHWEEEVEQVAEDKATRAQTLGPHLLLWVQNETSVTE